MSNTETDLNQASQNNSAQHPQTERQPLSRSLFVGLGVAAAGAWRSYLLRHSPA